jgi:hypothetical protein
MADSAESPRTKPQNFDREPPLSGGYDTNASTGRFDPADPAQDEDARRPIWMPEPHLVLAIGLLISIPALIQFVSSSIDIVGMLVRFLIALAVAWLGLLIVGNVINAYLPPPPPPESVPHALGEGDDVSNLSGYGNVYESTEPASSEGREQPGEAGSSGASAGEE